MVASETLRLLAAFSVVQLNRTSKRYAWVVSTAAGTVNANGIKAVCPEAPS